MQSYENRVDFDKLLMRVEKLGGMKIRIREEEDSILLCYTIDEEEKFTFLLSHPNPVRRQTIAFIYRTWIEELGKRQMIIF